MSIQKLEPEPFFAVCDLSFRSLREAAFRIIGLTKLKRLIALVKPQFEWEHPSEEFDGVVQDADTLQKIIMELAASLMAEGLYIADLLESPIRGQSGNREFFFDLNVKDGLSLSDINEKLIILIDKQNMP